MSRSSILYYTPTMEKKRFDTMEEFFKEYKLIDYKKNETIIRPDDNASVYYIKKGYVRMHTYSNEGKELTAIILQAGEVFPLNLILPDATNIYWFETITPVSAYKAPLEALRTHIKTDISLYEQITTQSILHMSAVMHRMQHIILGKAKTTVASMILIYSKLLGTRKDNEVILKIPITHQHISFSAGITRETTSLEIKRLENSGIISYKGRKLVVTDLKKLEEEAYI